MDRKTEPSMPLTGRLLNEGPHAGASGKPQKGRPRRTEWPEEEPHSSPKSAAKAARSGASVRSGQGIGQDLGQSLGEPPIRGTGFGPKRLAGFRTKTSNPSDGRRTSRKRAKPLTEARVRNIAEHYVGQRECSAQMLREVLERRLTRYLRDTQEDLDDRAVREEASMLIEAEISRLVGAGLINDARFAEMKSRGWLASGRGSRRILMDLARKGVDEDTARQAFEEAARDVTGTLGREDVDDREVAVSAEWEAADNLAKKKRLGPYRTAPLPEDRSERQKLWRREASAMARAGFGMDIIYQFLDREAREED